MSKPGFAGRAQQRDVRGDLRIRAEVPSTFRFAVNVTPRPGILDPQGRAVEQSLPHLQISGVSGVRVGRRVELSVAAADEDAARALVDRLAGELLSNPLAEP